MTIHPEIKAGQRWVNSDSENANKTAKVEYVTEIDVFYIVFLEGFRAFSYGETREVFLSRYKLIPEPKTRPINKSDIMKMLAVNPVLFYKGEHNPDWWMLRSSQELPPDTSNTIYSHNPFAPNAEIVGPMVTDEVGLAP
jgi:hypothetical protein